MTGGIKSVDKKNKKDRSFLIGLGIGGGVFLVLAIIGAWWKFFAMVIFIWAVTNFSIEAYKRAKKRYDEFNEPYKPTVYKPTTSSQYRSMVSMSPSSYSLSPSPTPSPSTTPSPSPTPSPSLLDEAGWSFESPVDIKQGETYELLIDPIENKPMFLTYKDKTYDLKAK